MGLQEKLLAQWPKLYKVAGATLTVGSTDIPAIVGGNVRHGREDLFDAGRNVRRAMLTVKASDWAGVSGTVETKLLWGKRRWRVASEETVPGVSPFVQLEIIAE